MNKRGWLRIMEAFMAILILSGVFVFFSLHTDEGIESAYIHERQQEILSIVTRNATIREEILQDEHNMVDQEISRLVPGSWGFTTRVCALDDLCSGEVPFDRNVFMSETIVTTDDEQYAPRKLRFFVWIR